MSELTELWKKYNHYSLEISLVLGRTSNIVGEYAEHLVNAHLKGKLLDASTASADIETPDSKLFQVKARKISKITSTQLSIIRSWDFDFLAVVLFDKNGGVLKSIICPVNMAKKYAVPNKHQNGWVITTTQEFLNDSGNLNITDSIRNLNGENILETEDTLSENETSNSSNRMSRKEALLIADDFFNEPVNPKCFVFSNQNKANEKWWLEPKVNAFENDLFIALNDNNLSKIYLFKIPGNELVPPEKYFKIRNDVKRISMNIDGYDIQEFKDTSRGSANIKLKKYLVGSLKIMA